MSKTHPPPAPYKICNESPVCLLRGGTVVDIEKWSSPPSYDAILELDGQSEGERRDQQMTIEIQTDGLPSYDEACRINNINNNYI